MNSRIQLKQLITKNPMQALKQIEALLSDQEDQELFNVLIVLKSELIRIEQSQKTGTIDNDEYRRQLNRINLNIISLIDDLPDGYLDQPPEADENPELSRFSLIVADLIRELGKLDIQEAKALAVPTQPATTPVFIQINRQRHIIALQAIRLIEQERLSISSLEYAQIAQAFYRNVDVIKSEQIYKKAIRNVDEYTDSASSKIAVIRGYAQFLYNIGRPKEGERQYESAILEGISETDNVNNGQTYQMRFANECDIPDYDSALISYKKAKEYFIKINNNFTRNYNLTALESAWNEKKVPPNYSRP